MNDSATSAKSASGEMDALLTLLQLESSARRVLEQDALPFMIVNETRRLLNYRQAILFKKASNTLPQAMQVKTISSIAVVDRNTPMVQWLERTVAILYRPDADGSARRFDANQAPIDVAQAWLEFSLPHVVWTPLRTPSGIILGGLWLARETPWNDNELVLLERLCETYAHAWQAMPKPVSVPFFKHRRLRYGAIALLLALLIPVRMSALAPVEIVPKLPSVVSAPLDGVIKEVTVNPNDAVRDGQVLFRFEDTVLRNNHAVAEKSLAIAEAEHLRAMQAAFMDEKNKADVTLLKTKVDLARAERDYARDVLGRVDVKAAFDGVAIFRDPADWIGKPVKTGERIMEIANPKRIALRISLPVKDAITLQTGAEVRAFLDADPLHPLSGYVTQAWYQAEVMPGQILAYRLDADLPVDALPEAVRIGWQGTAKVYGERVPLMFYIFRRPFAALRQIMGF